MTEAPHSTPEGAPSAPAPADGPWGWLRGLGIQRRRDGRWIAGVCNGLAHRLGVDPVLVRAAFVLILVFGAFGLPIYLVLWALLPGDRGDILAEDAVRRGGVRRIAFIVVVAAVVLGSVGGRWWIWLVVVPAAAIAYVVARSRREGRSPAQVGQEVTQVTARLGDRVGEWVSRAPTSGGSPASPATAAAGYPTSSMSSAAAEAPPAPYGMGPGRTGAVTTSAPRVIQRRRPRGGFLGLLLAVGLGAIGYAVGLQVASGRGADLGQTFDPTTFASACALAGVGLALLMIGLLGRRAGFVGLLAILLAVGTVGHAVGRQGFWADGVGDQTWVVSEHPGVTDFRHGAGDSTLDLTGATVGSTLRLHQFAGDVTVLVPDGTTATIAATVGTGSLHVDGESDGDSDGTGQTRTFTVGSGATAVTLDVDLSVGDLTISKKAS